MEIQEYPKALYKGGDQAADHVIVADADAEAAKREDGYQMLGEQPAEEKPAAKTRKKQGDAE